MNGVAIPIEWLFATIAALTMGAFLNQQWELRKLRVDIQGMIKTVTRLNLLTQVVCHRMKIDYDRFDGPAE